MTQSNEKHEKIHELFSNILKNEDLGKIVNADYYFQNQTDANKIQSELAENLRKYLSLYALYLKENPLESEVNKSKCRQGTRLSTVYSRWRDNVYQNITPSTASEDTDNGKIIEKDPMSKVRQRLPESPISNLLLLEVKPNNGKEKNCKNRTEFTIYPQYFFTQLSCIHNIKDDPYIRLAIEDKNDLIAQQHYEEIQSLATKGYDLILSERPFWKEDVSLKVFIKRLDAHIEKLNSHNDKCTDIYTKIKAIVKQPQNHKKEIISTAEEKAEAWKNYILYIRKEKELFTEIQTQIDQQIKIKEFTKVPSQLQSLIEKKRASEEARIKIHNKCFGIDRDTSHKGNQRKLFSQQVAEILGNRDSKIYNAGGIDFDNIYTFITNVLNDVEKSMGLSWETDTISFKSQSKTNLATTTPLNLFIFEQIYAPQTTKIIIELFKNMEPGRKRANSVLTMLAMVVMIPDIFSREYYLKIIYNLYCSSRHYELNKQIKEKAVDSDILSYASPLFNENEWLQDSTEFFKHLALNFYPKIHELCKRSLIDHPDITAEDLLNYFRNITGEDLQNKTFENKQIESSKDSLITLRKNKELTTSIYKKYYSEFYNADTQEKFNKIASSTVENNSELKAIILRAIGEYRRTADLH